MAATPDWAAIVGADYVTPSDAATPSRVRPGTVDEVQALVRAAAAAGAPVVAEGLGRHTGLGAPLRDPVTVVQLDRLSGVLAHQAADMTVTVAAGCSLRAVAAQLATANQWLPIDPPAPDATTIGGLLAANLSGPLRASQGTARDLLLGLRLVGADGALVSSGGKVVKNVAGYDLSKLHVGAYGSLGILVEATFKVRPRPACERAIVIACRSAEEAGAVALDVRDLGDPFWLEAAGTRALADGPGEAAAVVVGLAGLPEEVDAARDAILAAMRAADRRAVVVDDGATLRLRLADFPLEPAPALLRCGTLPTDVGTVMALAERTAQAAGGSARCLAHAANGVVRVAVEREDAIAPVVHALRAHVASVRGSVVIDRASDAVKHALGTFGELGDGAALMRGLKVAYDPTGIFAPGRLGAIDPPRPT